MANDPRYQPIEILWTGDDQNVDWYVTTGPIVEVDAPAAAGGTSITVKPLKRLIANGAKVRFAPPGEAGIVATLSAEAKYGATTLTVSSLGGSLQLGETGRQVQDVTNWTLGAPISLPPSTTAVMTLAIAIQTAADGYVRGTLTDTNLGTTLTAQTYFYRLSKTNDPSSTLAYGPLVLRSF